jgi:stage V sporulation protein G
MQITEITIHPTNDGLVRAYASIVFDNCFMVGEIRVIQGLTGLFISFPAKKLTDGTHWDIDFPPTLKRDGRIEQAIIAEYEKVAARRRFIGNHKKVSIKRHERESRKIKFRLRCQFKGNSLLNKFDP